MTTTFEARQSWITPADVRTRFGFLQSPLQFLSFSGGPSGWSGMATARLSKPVSTRISRQRYFSSCRPALVCEAVNGKRTDPVSRRRTREGDSGFDVYATSDLHTDYEDNLSWVEKLSAEEYQNDVLLVAGDISDDLRIIRKTLASLVSKFKHVAFVPGNHELWVRGAAKDVTERNGNARNSMDKLAVVLDACEDLGVIINPQKIGNLWVVPVLSWHHQSFDTEPGIPDVPRASRLTISDYRCCEWPAIGSEVPGFGSKAIALHLDSLNDDSWIPAAEGCDVITFSHFLPRQELLPEKRFLYYPNMTKAVGSVPLRKRLERINPNIHVFGHSHFGWDSTLEDGIRYVQCPLCYPRERSARAKSIALLNSSLDRFKSQYWGTSTVVKEAKWLPARIYSTQNTPQIRVNGGANGKEARDDGSSFQLTKSIPSAQSSAASLGYMESGQLVNGRDSGEVGFSGRPQVRLPAWNDWLNNLKENQLASLSVKSLNGGVRPRPKKGARPLNGVMHTWHAAWSDYYKTRKRDPSNQELASWVSERWRQKAMRRNAKKKRKERRRNLRRNGTLDCKQEATKTG